MRYTHIPVVLFAAVFLCACASPAPEDTAPSTPTVKDSAPGCAGYATRYWDCCKAHCGWRENAGPVDPVLSCTAADEPQPALFSAPSSCTAAGPDSAHTCFSMKPWAVSPTLAYGFAAVPAAGDICGRCYRLDFTGRGHHDPNDPGSAALADKTLVVQATNIGYDVHGGQFDILIPGGGVGAFNACSAQWGVPDEALGAQYGGFLTACRAQVGGSHDALKACVRNRCEAVFADDRLSELREGCLWFVDWYEAADNPDLRYEEVECPQGIVDVSGVDRRPVGDIQSACEPPAEQPPAEQPPAEQPSPGQCECDCSWTAGGAHCGTDDGSCCWQACCDAAAPAQPEPEPEPDCDPREPAPPACECDCGWAAGGAHCGTDDGSCCWQVCCDSGDALQPGACAD